MLCCMCLLENSKMLDIFDKKGKFLNIAVVIDTHFWFKVMLHYSRIPSLLNHTLIPDTC